MNKYVKKILTEEEKEKERRRRRINRKLDLVVKEDWFSRVKLALLNLYYEPSRILCYFSFHKPIRSNFSWSSEDVGRIGLVCDRCGKTITYVPLDDMPESYRSFILERIKECKLRERLTRGEEV